MLLVAASGACQQAPDASSIDDGSGGEPGADASNGRGGAGRGAGGAKQTGAGGRVAEIDAPVESGTGGSAGASADAASPSDVSAPADAEPPPDTGAIPDGGARPEGPAPSPACAGGAMAPGPAGKQSIQATGKNRTFIIRMPTGYDGKRPFPVMFAFHGAGGGAEAFESGSFGAISRMAADKAIRIFPQAYGGNTWSRDEADDVLFMDALMQWLNGKVCYDTGSVYATGQSSGAYFSHRFACDRGNVVRAVGTNSGGERRERALECKTPVSAWLSTGRADNPGHVMGTRQARDVWLKLAGCSLTGATPTTPSPCVSYPGCRPGYAVHYCEHGGGHAFPAYGASGIYNFLFGAKP
jgi:poly(3-hydroxybutyrate) depolymerase